MTKISDIMRMKSIMKNKCWHIFWILPALITLSFGSCSSDDNEKNEGFDPSKPIVISGFTPETGGLGTRLIISGENFGVDPTKVKVTIGGVSAAVVGVDKTNLYCLVPPKAYEGTIHIEMVDDQGETIIEHTVEQKFTYEKKMLVSTFIGYKDDKNNFQVKDGPFSTTGDCGGVGRSWWLSFDPLNHDHLYIAGEGQVLRMADFGEQYLSSKNEIHWKKIRALAWTLEGDMLVVHDQDSEKETGIYTVPRETGFKSPVSLLQRQRCNTAAIHPQNGELYYNYYDAGSVFRYDFETKESEQLFLLNDKNFDFSIQIHPSGNFAYIIIHNQHYIMRTDYNHAEKKFTIPYIVCGQQGSGSWKDDMGKKARLNQPRQGAFVKNPAYEGKADEYDFYFCERDNHCVRILTPEGRVTTFAGRGSPSLNKDAHGYVNGDLRLEARFDNPEGLVYDEERKCFFIGDRTNRRIRKIAYEDD